MRYHQGCNLPDHGSDAAASAAININGGNYSAGGTIPRLNRWQWNFYAPIGPPSPQTLLELGVGNQWHAQDWRWGAASPANTLCTFMLRCNGTIDFVSNVTLSTSNAIPANLANTVTIENGVVVTVAQRRWCTFSSGCFYERPELYGFRR